MKLTVNNEEIEIKVKGAYSEKPSKEDAKAFLCDIICSLQLAKERAEEIGCYAIAKKIRKQMDDIHNHLDSVGYFEGL